MKASVYATLALLAAGAGFAVYKFTISPRIEATIVGDTAATALPAAAQTSADTPTGAPVVLPEFTLQDRDGNARSINSWRDKSMIVNFWATWCAPCRREIPLLKELQRQQGPQGYQVVGVAVDFRDDVLKYANEINIDYPLLIGEEDGLEAVIKFGLGSIGFPFTAFTDKQHRIVALHVGELSRAQADVLLAAVDKVNRGELTPQAARVVVAKQLSELELTKS